MRCLRFSRALPFLPRHLPPSTPNFYRKCDVLSVLDVARVSCDFERRLAMAMCLFLFSMRWFFEVRGDVSGFTYAATSTKLSQPPLHHC